jgi:hypothetical protein
MSALFFACYNSQLTEQELFFNDISESESESGSELSSPSTPSNCKYNYHTITTITAPHFFQQNLILNKQWKWWHHKETCLSQKSSLKTNYTVLKELKVYSIESHRVRDFLLTRYQCLRERNFRPFFGWGTGRR